VTPRGRVKKSKIDWRDAPALEKRLANEFAALGFQIRVSFMGPGHRVQIYMEKKWLDPITLDEDSHQLGSLRKVEKHARRIVHRRCEYVERRKP
jgi:hypothetical protein